MTDSFHRVRYDLDDTQLFAERTEWQLHLIPDFLPEFLEWMNETFGDRWTHEYLYRSVRPNAFSFAYLAGRGNQGEWIYVPVAADIILPTEGDGLVYRLHWNKTS